MSRWNIVTTDRVFKFDVDANTQEEMELEKYTYKNFFKTNSWIKVNMTPL